MSSAPKPHLEVPHFLQSVAGAKSTPRVAVSEQSPGDDLATDHHMANAMAVEDWGEGRSAREASHAIDDEVETDDHVDGDSDRRTGSHHSVPECFQVVLSLTRTPGEVQVRQADSAVETTVKTRNAITATQKAA